MAYSTFERWSGSAWVNEPNLMRLTVSDFLYRPSLATLTIADPNNTVAANYLPYQKVRVKEGSTNIILFYGKVKNILPENDGQYGQILVIEAQDNLSELTSRDMEADYSTAQNAAWSRKSALIASIISGYSTSHPAHSFSGNITTNTTKTQVSAVSESGTRKWNFKAEGSGDNALETISKLATAEPHSGNRESFGYGFHLDYRTSGNTVYSDFNYHKRGENPVGASATYGLTVEYGAVEADQKKSMYSDFSFESKNVQELITRVDVSWVDENKKPQSISFVLINTGAHTGTFSENEAITWAGAHAATIRKIGGSGSARHALISDFTVAGLAALPAATITGTSSSATAVVNTSSGSPPGVLSVAIEEDRVESLSLSDFESIDEVYQATFALLFQTNDSVERGEFRVSKWPYITITGTHTGSNNAAALTDSSKTFTNSSIQPGSIIENTTDGSSAEVSGTVTNTGIPGSLSGGTENDWDTNDAYKLYKLIRAGSSIHVTNSRLSINKEFIVTGIEYDEGGGVIESLVQVMSVVRGVSGRRTLAVSAAKKLNTASGSNKGKTGTTPLSQMQFASTVNFSETDYNTVAWVAGSLTYGDGTAYSVSTAGNTGNMSADTPYYIYFDADVSTTALQTTSTHANVIGPNKTLLCTALAGATTVDPPQIRAQQGDTGAPSPKTFVQDAAPTSTTTNPLKRGDIWFDSNDGNHLYRWNGSAWASQRDATIATAQSTAAGKNQVFIGSSAPTANAVGDLWIDTGNGSALKRWSGSAWADAESFLNDTWTNAGRTSVVGGKIETNLIILDQATGSGANTTNVIQNRTNSPSTAGAGTNRILLSADGIFGKNSSNATNFAITQASGGAGIFGGGTVVMDAAGLTMTDGGYVRSAGKTYNSNTAGFWLGYDTNAYKFEIGKANGNYLRWDGANLSVAGTITLSDGTAEAAIKNSAVNAAHVGLENVSNQSASTLQTNILNAADADDVNLGNVDNLDREDQVKYGLHDEPTITQGGLIVQAGGALRSYGKTYDSSTAGWWIGYDSNAYKFEIGQNDGNYVQWTGSGINVSGYLSGTSSLRLGDDGGDGTTVGKITMYDQNNAIALRMRAFASYNQWDSFNRGTWFVGNHTDATGVTIDGHNWPNQLRYFGAGFSSTYLGSPATSSHGAGWAALVLGGTGGSAGTVVLQAPLSNYNQRLITLPNGADFNFNGGSSGNFLTTNGSGTLSWASVSSSDTTYSTSWVDSSANAILRLTAGGSGSGNDDLTIVAGSNITLTPSGDNLTIAATDTNTVYTHPTQSGADLDVDTGTLSGATVFSNLSFDMFSDGTGHITSAGSTIGTRNLTAGDVGAATSGHNHSGTYATSGHNHSGTYDDYDKWIINGVSTSGSTWITSGETVAFHGSGGISTSWSGTYNTLTISSTNSSQRYKENIENLTLDTAKIYNLVPRSFTWRNDPDDPVGNRLDGQSDFGLVAEEVHAIMPELVWNNDDDEIEGVKYMTLSVLLLAELKKLKARVEVLEG